MTADELIQELEAADPKAVVFLVIKGKSFLVSEVKSDGIEVNIIGDM